jgi:hypothetical protein
MSATTVRIDDNAPESRTLGTTIKPSRLYAATSASEIMPSIFQRLGPLDVNAVCQTRKALLQPVDIPKGPSQYRSVAAADIPAYIPRLAAE